MIPYANKISIVYLFRIDKSGATAELSQKPQDTDNIVYFYYLLFDLMLHIILYPVVTCLNKYKNKEDQFMKWHSSNVYNNNYNDN